MSGSGIQAAGRLAAIFVLTDLGTTLRDVDIAVDDDRTVARAETYAYHRHWLDRTPERYEPEPETVRRIRSGETVTGADYVDRWRDLQRMRRAYNHRAGLRTGRVSRFVLADPSCSPRVAAAWQNKPLRPGGQSPENRFKLATHRSVRGFPLGSRGAGQCAPLHGDAGRVNAHVQVIPASAASTTARHADEIA